MLLSLEWQKCWEMFRQRSLMFAAYFPYEAIESATLFCESTTLLPQSTTFFCESATLFFVNNQLFIKNKVADWTISLF
jgi:hypothetical protein